MSSTRTGRKYSPSSEGVASAGFARGIAGAGARIASHRDVKVVYPKGGRDEWLKTSEEDKTNYGFTDVDNLFQSFVDDEDGAVDDDNDGGGKDEEEDEEDEEDEEEEEDIWEAMADRDGQIKSLAMRLDKLTMVVDKLVKVIKKGQNVVSPKKTETMKVSNFETPRTPSVFMSPLSADSGSSTVSPDRTGKLHEMPVTHKTPERGPTLKGPDLGPVALTPGNTYIGKIEIRGVIYPVYRGPGSTDESRRGVFIYRNGTKTYITDNEKKIKSVNTVNW